MFRTSSLLKAKSLLVGSCFALVVSTGAASASPFGGFSLSIGSKFVEAGLSCPAGTHSGYEGRYCWPNRTSTSGCPAGFHLGYEDKYCWPNR